MRQDVDAVAKNLDNLSNQALEYSRDKKLDRCKIVTSISQNMRLVVENGDFALANSIEDASTTIIVHHEQKKGSVSINTANSEDYVRAIDDAAAMAKFSVADDALNMPDASLAPKAQKLDGLFDTELADISLETIQDSMSKAMEGLLSDKRVCLDRFEMALGIYRHSLKNSLGVQQSETQTSIDWDFLGMSREGDSVSGMDYDSGFAFKRQGYEQKLLAEVEGFKDRVLSNLNPRKAPSYRGEVILHPRAVSSLLLSPILFHASGRQVMDGRSKWEKRVGEKIAFEGLTLIDEPHDTQLSSATAYDSDGIPTRRDSIVEKGVLSQHLHDCYSAKKLGVKTTATSGGPFALHVHPGSHDPQSFLDARAEILMVQRFSGNVDPLTGDFSGVAKCSSLYEKGQRVGAVSETMISGNSFDLLNSILGIGNSCEVVSGGYVCPQILVDGVSVSGS